MKIPQKDRTTRLQLNTNMMRRREQRKRKLIRKLVLLAILSGLSVAYVLSACQWDSQTTVEEQESKEVLTISQTPVNTSTPVEVDLEPPAQPILEEKPVVKKEAPKIFKLTAYCIENYPHICNDGDATHTATGTVPTPGRTIAVDPKVIPYGSEVVIYGHTYIVEDCGGAIKGNCIDIVFETHEEALDFGVQYAEVEVK